MRIRSLAKVVSIGIALLLGDFDSFAEAGLLKNGVRPGDRKKMHIVRPPRSGSQKRIHRPGEQRQAPATRKRRKQQHAWFWKTHAVALTAASGKRWGKALETMTTRQSQGKHIVPEARVQNISDTYSAEIRSAARRHNVSELLLTAVIAVESAGKSKAVSPKGARGLMQLIPATAARFGVEDSFDTQQNVNGGAAYLNWLLKEFRGDVLLALAGYNAGEGAVKKHGGVPPFTETRDYVVKVMDAVAVGRGLCRTPPTGPRASCTVRPGSSS